MAQCCLQTLEIVSQHDCAWSSVGRRIWSAYLSHNIATATGTVNEAAKLLLFDGAASDEFGVSVSLEGDGFVIGAIFADGVEKDTGKVYNGRVSSVMTLDAGNADRRIDGISFFSRGAWVIGKNTDGNLVSLETGDAANVTNSGKHVYIGKRGTTS